MYYIWGERNILGGKNVKKKLWSTQKVASFMLKLFGGKLEGGKKIFVGISPMSPCGTPTGWYNPKNVLYKQSLLTNSGHQYFNSLYVMEPNNTVFNFYCNLMLLQVWCLWWCSALCYWVSLSIWCPIWPVWSGSHVSPPSWSCLWSRWSGKPNGLLQLWGQIALSREQQR